MFTPIIIAYWWRLFIDKIISKELQAEKIIFITKLFIFNFQKTPSDWEKAVFKQKYDNY